MFVNATFSVEVTVRDAQGGTATGYTQQVTITLQGPLDVSFLSGQKTVTPVNGIATFSNLKITGACVGCTLVASAPGVTSATSAQFTVLGL